MNTPQHPGSTSVPDAPNDRTDTSGRAATNNIRGERPDWETSSSSPASEAYLNAESRPYHTSKNHTSETTGSGAGGGVMRLSPHEMPRTRWYHIVFRRMGQLLGLPGQNNGVDLVKSFSQWLAVSSGAFALGNAIALWANGIPRPSLLNTIGQNMATQLAAQGWNTVTINLLWTALFGVVWVLSLRGGPMDRWVAWSQRSKLWTTEREAAAEKKRRRTADGGPGAARLRTSIQALLGIKNDPDAKARRRRQSEAIWNAWLALVAIGSVWAGIAMSAIITSTAIQSAGLSATLRVNQARAAMMALAYQHPDQPIDRNAYQRACTVAQVRANDRLNAGNGGTSDGEAGRSALGDGVEALVLANNEKLLYAQGCRDAATMARNLQKIAAGINQSPELATDRWPIFPGWVAMHDHVRMLAHQAVELTPAAWTELQAGRLATEERIQGRADWAVRNTTSSQAHPEGSTAEGGTALLRAIAAQAPQTVATPDEMAALLYVAPMPGQHPAIKTPVSVEQVQEALTRLKTAAQTSPTSMLDTMLIRRTAETRPIRGGADRPK